MFISPFDTNFFSIMPTIRPNRPNYPAPGSASTSPKNPNAHKYNPLQDEASDEWYYNMIKQYEGTDWYQQMLNNPYLRGNNAEFSPDLGQQFLMMFGDDSAERRYYGDLLSKRNAEFNRILDEMRQYKQNSPANESSLMSAAGQNADLLGTSGVAGAPENDNIPAPFLPSESSGAGLPNFQAFGNIALSFISSCFGFAKSIQDLRLGNRAIDAADASIAGNEIDNHNKALGFAGNLLTNSVAASEIDVDKLENDPSYAGSILLDAAKKIDTSLYSRRTRKMINAYLNQLQRDPVSGDETYFLKNAKAELLNRFTTLQSDTAEKRAHKWYSDDLNKMIKSMADEFVQYQDEYTKLYNKYLKKSASNSLNVENTPGIATSRAIGEMSDNRIKQISANVNEATYNATIPQWEINKLNNNFKHRLTNRFQSFGTIGAFGSLMLPGLFSSLENAVPNKIQSVKDNAKIAAKVATGM